MSKSDKLLARLLATPPPKDFTWDELVTLLKGKGFEPLTSSGGSARKFYHHERGTLIRLHEPHPQRTLKTYMIKEVIGKLKDEGFVS
ncbi:MAG: type II toxin-antitoxin system HicA family toxin [bacterium]